MVDRVLEPVASSGASSGAISELADRPPHWPRTLLRVHSPVCWILACSVLARLLFLLLDPLLAPSPTRQLATHCGQVNCQCSEATRLIIACWIDCIADSPLTLACAAVDFKTDFEFCLFGAYRMPCLYLIDG